PADSLTECNAPILPGAPPVDHVALAVRDTADALRLYVDVLGLRAEPAEIVPSENLKVTFLNGPNTRMEILEPLPGDSAVARFLDKRGEGLHHVCFVVPSIAETLGALGEAGYQLVDQQARPGRHGEMVAFVHPKSTNGVMIELYERRTTAQRGAAGGSANGGTDESTRGAEPESATGEGG
ncbi:MAG TPA: methylmalonyl-CoA epimerase, partial [Chloroflexota bacterium]|nr:methylmalonyl-CoA epimerase [Chloroflexota bacterium]